MINTTWSTILPVIEHYENTMAVGSIKPVSDLPGLAWDQVNELKELWTNAGPYFIKTMPKMNVLFLAVHELKHHTGSIYELSSRTVSVLSMMNYDASGLGPVIGGLNGEHLSPSNPFGNQGVQFAQAKTPLIEFATERFNQYKTDLTNEGGLNAYIASFFSV